jgi:hypothetical protein
LVVTREKWKKNNILLEQLMDEIQPTYHSQQEIIILWENMKYFMDIMKDSGYVRGKIVGDTLLGAYYYKSYGGLGLSKPIALLMKEDKLLLGSGVQSSVLGLFFYY